LLKFEHNGQWRTATRKATEPSLLRSIRCVAASVFSRKITGIGRWVHHFATQYLSFIGLLSAVMPEFSQTRTKLERDSNGPDATCDIRPNSISALIASPGGDRTTRQSHLLDLFHDLLTDAEGRDAVTVCTSRLTLAAPVHLTSW